MLVDQAIFASSKNTGGSGYQLVGRSLGIDDVYATKLRDWGPSQGALLSKEHNAHAYSYFQLSPEKSVVAKTIYGGPEYSQRGELQTFTRFVVLPRHIFEFYDHNPWNVIRTVLVLGHFQLLEDPKTELEQIDLPDRTLLGVKRPIAETLSDSVISQIGKAVQTDRPIALVSQRDPTVIARSCFENINRQLRTQLSFTTGMVPSVSRPFQLHLLPEVTTSMRSKLMRLGIETVTAA